MRIVRVHRQTGRSRSALSAFSAQEGIAGHEMAASRGASSYRTEISLAGDYKHLSVR